MNHRIVDFIHSNTYSLPILEICGVLLITLNLQLSWECKAVVSKYRTQPGLGIDPTENSLANKQEKLLDF